MLKWLLGYYRLSVSGLILGLGGTLIIITSWIPFSIKGYRLSMWVLTFVVRALLFILGVQVTCEEWERLRQFHGFVFPNHVTYLDVLVLIAIAPMRFLAKQEVRAMPIIGLIAQAIGCVFVQREDKESRAEARTALAQVETFPPVALFPEGKRGPGHELRPFRYGAFEIVINGEIPILTCAISYEPLEIAIWHRGESIIKAILRLASHDKSVQARVRPLEVIQPPPDADPVAMSKSVHGAMTAVLFPATPTDKPGSVAI